MCCVKVKARCPKAKVCCKGSVDCMAATMTAITATASVSLCSPKGFRKLISRFHGHQWKKLLGRIGSQTTMATAMAMALVAPTVTATWSIDTRPLADAMHLPNHSPLLKKACVRQVISARQVVPLECKSLLEACLDWSRAWLPGYNLLHDTTLH